MTSALRLSSFSEIPIAANSLANLKKSTNCHLGETLITDSGLTATQLFMEDDSVFPGKNILYQDSNLLYLGQGSTLELEMPFGLIVTSGADFNNTAYHSSSQ
jgi:hypothetical protein